MSRALWYVAGIAWLGASGAGLAGLWRYSLTPAVTMAAPPSWPAGSSLLRTPDRFNLVMFLHPACPCSRASIEELGVLLSRSAGKISPNVVFFTPEEKQAEWNDSPLWRQAREIPGLRSTADSEGREASLFGAEASGETFVYDSRGNLVFHGGITLARGHSGDNDGLDAVLRLVIGRSAVAAEGVGSSDNSPPERSPVYGCSLRGKTLKFPAEKEAPSE